MVYYQNHHVFTGIDYAGFGDAISNEMFHNWSG